jgi:hypothetical protein|tara:strand:+ start:149 stop:706 length:558 start_codon:yes stop_codon:yes gene_type:complete
MEDVLGINNQSAGSYLKHSHKNNCWQINGESVSDIVYLLVDPTTIKTGWGCYDGEYDYVWDEKPSVRVPQPSPDYKRAFSVRLYSKEYGNLLWQGYTWGEAQGFNNMCRLFWDEISSQNGNVAMIKYTGTEEKQFKVGSSSVPLFEFSKWVPKPSEFTQDAQQEILPNEDNTSDLIGDDSDPLPF